jgi:hypothetical protein
MDSEPRYLDAHLAQSKQVAYIASLVQACTAINNIAVLPLEQIEKMFCSHELD